MIAWLEQYINGSEYLTSWLLSRGSEKFIHEKGNFMSSWIISLSIKADYFKSSTK